MRIRLACPNAACGRRIDATASEESIACPACGTRIPLAVDQSLDDGVLVRCPCCQCEELFIRKDFPQKAGLLLVIVTGVASCVLFGYGRLLWALGLLVAVVLLDWVLALLLPKITVCYRCRAEFRGLGLNPRHEGFDLATAEKYRGAA